ncbi:MAG TPA: HDIG domain-containing protein [Candidatus Polarisedimenticolaceae bacterium]
MNEAGARGRRPLPGSAAPRAADGPRWFGSDALWSVFFAVVMIALLGTRACSDTERFQVGDRAAHDIVARADVEVPDPGLTQARRSEARAAVPDVYVHDRQRSDRLLAEFSAEARARFPGAQAAHEAGAAAMREVMGGIVVSNRTVLERQPAILVAHVPGGTEDRLESYERILDLEQARARVRELLREDPALADLASRFVDANTAFDPAATAARRDRAGSDVLPIQVRVPKGTVLVREGEAITAENLARIEAARRTPFATTSAVGQIGIAVVVAMLAFFLHRYTRYHQRAFKKVRHLHALLVSVLVTMLLVAQALLGIAAEATDRLGAPFNDLSLYAYLVPFGGGAMLVALLASGRIAMVYSAFAAVFFGAATGWDAYRMVWTLLVQWAGVYAITTYRERAALIRAGLVVGAAGAVAALAIEAIRRTLEPLSHSLYGAGLAFVGGALGAGILVSFALPVLERAFHVLTDVRLLELSNVSHPLLSQLAVKAPGTYNHSMTVGTLAEEAAKAIGANSLFCRVAAFYHDIGKLKKPEYYVENQRGMNPHDRLAPSMSALIVAAHVKDGIKLARDARLPEQIVDIIPQHHGTRRMSYFFEKAKRTANPALGEVHEEDFRYPGPKPQTREAAIFMLADGIEAAARTLEDPTPNRLREVIHKIASSVVLDGQFDECDLTFADLERIEEAFLRTLTSMYHHRVDYPGFEFGRPRAERTESRGEVRAFRAP